MTVVARGRSLFLTAFCLIAGASCAPPRPTLPSGAGSPFPAFPTAYEEATHGCSDVKTFTAVTHVSGRAGKTKLRSRIDAALEAPDGVVLEAIVLGRPVFVLSARGSDSTLFLRRDHRVLRGAAPAEIIEALAGARLEPAELRTILAGCGLAVTDPANGRSYDNGWVAGGTDATTTFLNQIEGKWRIVAATRPPLTVQYTDFKEGRAMTVHVRSMSGGNEAAADLTLKLSDVEINAPIDPRAFEIVVPRDAMPLTLEELRRAGPLGASSTEGTELRDPAEP